MEHTSDVVGEGKLIGETSYPGKAKIYRNKADGIKIDFYDAKKKVLAMVGAVRISIPLWCD